MSKSKSKSGSSSSSNTASSKTSSTGAENERRDAEKAEKAEKVEALHAERSESHRGDDGAGRHDGTGHRSDDRTGGPAHDDGLSDDGKVETTTYELRDGVQTAVSHLEVATVNSRRLETAQFSFGADGAVTGMFEGRLDRDQTLTFRTETIESNESLTALSIGGVRYVLVQEAEMGRVEFGLYRDDNGDGVWTEVLEGHLLGTSQDVVALVGSTPQLALAAGIVG